MRMHIVASLLLPALLSRKAVAQCGGEERWAVKMAADPGATQIDLSPMRTSLHDLVLVARPTLPSDDVTRTPAERVVHTIDARLVKFKQETGKTGDSDFHLVISDETLLFSPGGAGTQASPHSVIAEIVDPDCVAGRKGTVTGESQLKVQIAGVRARFVAQFPTIASGWNDAEGIPVRLTGVAFFDRPHGQVGRALNGLELHPLIDIEFNPTASLTPTSPVTTPSGSAVAFENPGFEDGDQGWIATEGVITGSTQQRAHSGQRMAWLGGYGETHRDRLRHAVTLPASAHAIALSFFLHVDTEENAQQASDKLFIRVRDAAGTLLRTVKTISNQAAAPGYTLQTLDLSEFKGRSIIIEFESREDASASTSFVLDDFTLVIEP